MLTKEELEVKIRKLAEEHGVDINEKNIKKIINAKFLLFSDEGTDEALFRCPCDANNLERGCISKVCLSDVMNTGTCHCHLMQKRE